MERIFGEKGCDTLVMFGPVKEINKELINYLEENCDKEATVLLVNFSNPSLALNYKMKLQNECNCKESLTVLKIKELIEKGFDGTKLIIYKRDISTADYYKDLSKPFNPPFYKRSVFTTTPNPYAELEAAGFTPEQFFGYKKSNKK